MLWATQSPYWQERYVCENLLSSIQRVGTACAGTLLCAYGSPISPNLPASYANRANDVRELLQELLFI